MNASTLRPILEQLVSGPPHTRALGFKLEALEDRAVTLSVPYRAEFAGDAHSGVIAGGVVSTLLDHCCGMAVWAALERYQVIATLDMRIDYMRAARPGLAILARAEAFKLTSSVAFVRGVAFDADPDDPVAAVQAAFMLDSDAGRSPGANLKGSAA
ncbi:PaaI family thioesterase [Brevundimonas sp.]|uniref:PaaI family thioesterase n=1 Tax=Brevundimonas sp. TaxID=1871086 RepID=UPI0025D7BB6F|nr:PaaI family thioesterase [Brevundimonas sp.]